MKRFAILALFLALVVTTGQTATVKTSCNALCWREIDVTYDELSVAATTKDLQLVELPEQSSLGYVVLTVLVPGGFSDTLTLSVGTNASDYDNVVVDSDGKADQGTTYGDQDAERGTLIPDADVVAVAIQQSATGLYLHADGNATNLDQLSAGAWHIVVFYWELP